MRNKQAKKLKDIAKLMTFGKSEIETRKVYQQLKSIHKKKSNK